MPKLMLNGQGTRVANPHHDNLNKDYLTLQVFYYQHSVFKMGNPHIFRLSVWMQFLFDKDTTGLNLVCILQTKDFVN